MTAAFIHGLESSGRGTKGTYFGNRYPDMIIEDYFGTLEERMKKLKKVLDGKSGIVLVGSSYGGLMAAMYALDYPLRVAKLVLLAPALDLDEFNPYRDRKLSIPVIVYHGSDDDVVPMAPVRQISESIFTNLVYHVVKDDHPLSETFSTFNWDDLLDRETNPLT